MINHIKQFIKESVRVFKITKKPSRQEYSAIIKVSSIGISIIGILGFLISIAWKLI